MTDSREVAVSPAPRLRIDADPEAVEKGLVTLVLTIVELLRQLMERQALPGWTRARSPTIRSRGSGPR